MLEATMARARDTIGDTSRSSLLESVAARLSRRDRRSLERPRRAAVLIPIVNDEGPLRLILTRRADGLSTHKGQVAFPGGGMEPEDDGPVDTASREAHEEIGLCHEHIDVLGLLDDFPTVDGEIAVTPVVAKLETLPELCADPEEVARIFTIPLDSLREPGRWEARHIEKYERKLPIYFFEHDGETLWGLSAYMVLHLLDACRLGVPFELPDAKIE